MALFLELATLAEKLAGEAGRLKKRALIEIALGGVAAASLEDAGRFCLYLAGQPFAEADPRKLNAGGALLTRAVKAVSGCSDAALTRLAKPRKRQTRNSSLWRCRPGM